jgi:hypothetical protein
MSNTIIKKHICIDFEGEGKRRDGSAPQPSLLGALVPGLDNWRPAYRVWLLEKKLYPLANPTHLIGKRCNRHKSDLQSAVLELVHLAEERSCRLVAFSQHELEMVKLHLRDWPELVQQFENLYWNVKSNAQRLCNRRRLKTPDRTLDSLIGALDPKYKIPPAPKCGAAESIRRLRVAGKKSRRWRSWSESQQQLARELLTYNCGDCKSVWKLVNHVS